MRTSENNKPSKVSSSEQLDKMIVIAPARYWIALIGGAIILICLIAWSFAGTVSETVTISGIYMGEGRVVCFADLSGGKQILASMDARMYPMITDNHAYGFLEAGVSEVDEFVTSYDEALDLLGAESLARKFCSGEPVHYVICTLVPDADSVCGYKWSNESSRSIQIDPGTIVEVDVVLRTKRPIELVFSA